MCLIKGHEGVCDYILFMRRFLERAGKCGRQYVRVKV